MNIKKVNGEYEVLCPWADVDPIPLRGITPRVTGLVGKKIGLFSSFKAMAKPILTAVESRLKERLPTSDISWYEASQRFTITQMEGENKTRFEEWVKGVDTVVAAVGD